MAKTALSRAIKLFGTDVPDGKRRTLTAGPITAMLDNGALRYIRYRGTEVLRGIAYLLRDKNWGTYGPAIEDLKVRQGKDGFSGQLHRHRQGQGTGHALCGPHRGQGRWHGAVPGDGNAAHRFPHQPHRLRRAASAGRRGGRDRSRSSTPTARSRSRASRNSSAPASRCSRSAR